MAKIYANLIQKGLKTLEDVPERLKDDVQTILSELGESPAIIMLEEGR